MKHQTKVILGGLIGNVVEAYDISICYFLANELSQTLMGGHKKSYTVILTLTFLAYLAKPIGAFFLGLLSDRYGRKNVLIGSILIMGLATTLIGLIPSHQYIGVLATALFLLLRIIQSMALGSEFLNSASFLVESGDYRQRGFRGCWSSVGVKAGYLLACIIVELIRHYAPGFAQSDWLWRIPFLLASITTMMGFLIRYAMPESLAYVVYYAERAKPTTGHIYKESLRYIKEYPFLCNYAFFASFLSVATGFFFYLYIPLHAMQYSHLSQVTIMTSTTLSLALVSLLIPVFGWISDKQDRLKMLAIATIGLFLLSYPFMHAVNYGNASYLLFMQLVISIPCACYYSVSSVILTELFPLPIRCTVLSIIFSIAASLAAGLPPLLANLLAKLTQAPSSPCIIMMVLALVVFANITVLRKQFSFLPGGMKSIESDWENTSSQSDNSLPAL